ncbi:MAG: AmpG family muropeptide MFS transporter [Desulfarculus sp.]|nr:AmpG family muropeptide MFS transporter [Desulfarculus sp.]
MAATLKSALSPRMLVAFMMGFSSGLPLLLTLSLLQAWMQQERVDLTLIGLITLVGLPYTFKFLWAPIFDRYRLPFLGRRRGWLFLVQLLLILAIAGLGQCDPKSQPLILGLMALAVAFLSASQDIVIDAYRREDLADDELGLGSSLYVNGYRVGMLLASGGGLILADHLAFSRVYLILAACLGVGLATTLAAREPKVSERPPTTLVEAVVEPFLEYFRRVNPYWALGVLALILLYKLGDTMASAMTMPFYLDLGFSKTEIGAVVKLFGFWATVAGGLIGGVLMLRLGINRALWVFGVLQAVSTAGFAVLAHLGPTVAGLASVIAFENLTGGMGTTAYVAFMAALTNKSFTATQYALLSSLMGIPRVILSAPTGWMAKEMGWSWFFIFCTLIALPGLLMLIKFAPWRQEAPPSAAEHTDPK